MWHRYQGAPSQADTHTRMPDCACVCVMCVSQYHLDAELTPADADLPLAQARLDPTMPTVLIDVRERDEYQAGHLPGAINIPMGQMLRDAGREGAEARTLIQQARADAGRVVFYCGSGVRARLTATQLRTVRPYHHDRRASRSILTSLLASSCSREPLICSIIQRDSRSSRRPRNSRHPVHCSCSTCSRHTIVVF